MEILVIRSYALLVPLLATAAAWLWQQPSGRKAGAVYLATLWTIPSLTVVQFLARRYEWWSFSFQGGGLAGMPAELFIGWMLLWGALPVLLFRRLSPAVVMGIAMTLDIVVMPLGAPVIHLGPAWLIGELVAASLILVPAQLLARWTEEDRRLSARVLMQMVLFTSTVIVLLPSWLLGLGLLWWSEPSSFSSLPRQALVQAAMLVALLGVTAVQELAERGRGTPFPYDPPKMLVRSGIYAYVRNPMQLSMTLLFLLCAVVMRSLWLAAGAFVLFTFAAGLAAWNEDSDLAERYGPAFTEYAQAVRTWLPSWRPWIREPATIYFAAGCDPCAQSASWLRRHGPRGLHFVDAESYPAVALERVRYERTDGSYEEGVAAIARALEHIHLGWALLGFAARLPIVRPLLQLIVDVSGGERRSLRPIR